MDKIMVTILLIIAGVVGVVLVVNTVYPAIGRSSSALVSASDKLNERIRSNISIIQATTELDADGAWQDTNADGNFDVFAWVKNVGDLKITAISRSDVFFGKEGDFSRIPYVTDAGGAYPYWEYSIVNGAEWGATVTVMITINYSAALAQGSYFIKVVLPNGISDEYSFSM